MHTPPFFLLSSSTNCYTDGDRYDERTLFLQHPPLNQTNDGAVIKNIAYGVFRKEEASCKEKAIVIIKCHATIPNLHA